MNPKPPGDLFTEEEERLHEKYKAQPDVQKDIDQLTSLLVNWYTSVFYNIMRNQSICPECTKLAKMEKIFDNKL